MIFVELPILLGNFASPGRNTGQWKGVIGVCGPGQPLAGHVTLTRSLNVEALVSQCAEQE